jgi:hypothetical protein
MRLPGSSRGVRLIALLVAAGLSAAGCDRPSLDAGPGFRLEPGDLLFQDLDCGPFCDAIEKVTVGYRGAKLSHVGIVAAEGPGRLAVIEAVSSGVSVTPLEVFMARSRDAAGRPKVLAGRLNAEHRHLVPAALREAFALKGRPYDKVFDIDNDAYYCSELVYRCFRRAGNGRPLFELQPMTFVDPDTGETFPAWRRYFAELGIPIPEGKPGINPGGISRSPALTIVHAYGLPSGWRQGPQEGR